MSNQFVVFFRVLVTVSCKFFVECSEHGHGHRGRKMPTVQDPGHTSTIHPHVHVHPGYTSTCTCTVHNYTHTLLFCVHFTARGGGYFFCSTLSLGARRYYADPSYTLRQS